MITALLTSLSGGAAVAVLDGRDTLEDRAMAETRRAADTRGANRRPTLFQKPAMTVPKRGSQSPPSQHPAARGGRQSCRAAVPRPGSGCAAMKYRVSSHRLGGELQGGGHDLRGQPAPDAGACRDPLLALSTRSGVDLQYEDLPAAGRGRANGNQRGLVGAVNPIRCMADVMYVPSSANRSHGSGLGAKLCEHRIGPGFHLASSTPSRR